MSDADGYGARLGRRPAGAGADLPLDVGAEVADAISSGRPVVALETTIISHGLPRPRNLEVARDIEGAVRAGGAVPATCGVIAGRLRVGLDGGELERFALGDGIIKLSARDLAVAAARGVDGATTVAGTLALASAAGIKVMATGGIGGVHREARRTWDVSADLLALRTYAVAVVAAGVKSILDVPATLEQLETLGVPVLGWRTHRFPGFYLSDSGLPLEWAVDDMAEAAVAVRAHLALSGAGGLLLANPVAVEHQLDPSLHDRVLAAALAQLGPRRITGKDVTPFLLGELVEATAGANVEANRHLVIANASLAAGLAAALVSA
jgi:pseudouridine-5'-phosphate glycosidase